MNRPVPLAEHPSFRTKLRVVPPSRHPLQDEINAKYELRNERAKREETW